jgi:hypothetical protein
MTPPSKKTTSASTPAKPKSAPTAKRKAPARSGGQPKGDDEDDGAQGKKGPISPPEMSQELIDFITAIDSYKRAHQRPFPSWGEVLDVLKSLGYERGA